MNRRSFLQYGAVGVLSFGIGFTASDSQRPEPTNSEPAESEETDDTFSDQVRILEHNLLTYETEDDEVEVADVNGFLLNVTEEPIETVVVLADFIDGDGNYVIYETTEILDLEPDQRTEFDVSFPIISGEDMLDRVERYELSVYQDASDLDLDKEYEFSPVGGNDE